MLDGFGQVEEYAHRWKNHGDYLCVSDHGMMAVIPRQLKACDASNKKDDPNRNKKLFPLFAIELYVNPMQIGYDEDKELQKYLKSLNPTELKLMRRRGFHLLAIAYNQTGYSNLVNLCSWGWTKGHYYRPRVNHEQLMLHKEGIIFTSCCYASEIGQAFDSGGEEAGYAMIEKYIAMFGKENFYLEIMLLDFSKQKPYDVFIIKAAQKYGLKIILSQDCLVKGTFVITDKGNKKIEDIITGDKVLTHKGRFKKVEHVNTRPINDRESVYRVKSALGTITWEVTGNHKVHVATIRRIKNKPISQLGWKRVDELTNGDYLVLPKIDSSWVFSKTDLNSIDLKPIISAETYNVVEGKIGTALANKLTLINNEFVSHHGFDHRSTIKIPSIIPVTDDLLKIIGLYIAEGGLDSANQISFGLHVSETKEEELVERYFGQFGIKITKYIVGQGRKVEFQSVVFRQFFESLCGKGCLNKQLPHIDGSFFGKFSYNQVMKIIGQYWLGDGSSPELHDRAGKVGSVSKKLIYDLSIVLNAMKFPVAPCVKKHGKNDKHKNPNANPFNWNDFYYLSFGGNTRVQFENMIGVSQKQLKPKLQDKGCRYIESKDYYLVKFKNLVKIDYSGFVYNLQVEEDETYYANLHGVHNCHYAFKEHSKYQQLMLMVQTKNTVQNIEKKKNEEGLKDMFELQDTNLWMKTEEELNEKYEKDYRDAIPLEIFEQAKLNTVEICRRARGVELDRSIKLPQIENANEKLKEAVMEGFYKLGLPKNRKYLDRIKEEYSLICHKGFASYCLIQKKMTDEARRIGREILGYGDGSEVIGCGRGSCVASLVFYCLGVTGVDPVYHDLLFKRFISEARGGKSIKLRFDTLPI